MQCFNNDVSASSYRSVTIFENECVAKEVTQSNGDKYHQCVLSTAGAQVNKKGTREPMNIIIMVGGAIWLKFSLCPVG